MYFLYQYAISLKPFSKIWSRRQTPVASLILILAIMIGFIFIGNIETIALLATLTIFITFFIVNLSNIVLRFRQPSIERPYRVPVNIKNVPIFSVLGIVLTLTLMIFNVVSLIQQ